MIAEISRIGLQNAMCKVLDREPCRAFGDRLPGRLRFVKHENQALKATQVQTKPQAVCNDTTFDKGGSSYPEGRITGCVGSRKCPSRNTINNLEPQTMWLAIPGWKHFFRALKKGK